MKEKQQIYELIQNETDNLVTEILQEVIKNIEQEYSDSSHTYLPEYRAVRQNCKKTIKLIVKIAKEKQIKLVTKQLSCKYD